MNKLNRLKKVNVGNKIYELHYAVEDDGTYRDDKLKWYKQRFAFDTLIKNGQALFFAKEIEDIPYREVVEVKELENK